MDIPLSFDLRCDECGCDLIGEHDVDYYGRNIIHVKPCEYCMGIALEDLAEEMGHSFNGCLDRED